MVRRFFSFGSVVALVLGVTTAVLWGRSYAHLDELVMVAGTSGFRIRSVAGTLHFGEASPRMYPHGWHWQTSDLAAGTGDWHWLYPSVTAQWSGAGFAVVDGGYDLGLCWVFYRVIVIPDWALVLGFAALPVARWTRWCLRRPRPTHPAGRCPKCGYDLRASPERCPECGTPVPGGPGVIPTQA